MTLRASVTVDLEKVRANTRRVREIVPDVAIVGVTKVVCGAPEVARAMLDGGAAAIGESRLENIERLRSAGIEAPFWLLRAPVPGLAADAVRLADVSLQSEAVTVEALSSAAVEAGRTHSVVLMIDVGDLREGVMPDDAFALIDRVDGLPGIHVLGLGTSLTCYGGVVPSKREMDLLISFAHVANNRFGRALTISAGMSSSLDLALSGYWSPRLNNLRIGESILLGVSTVTREPLPGMHTDAIVVGAPVIECQVKPSVPWGEIAQDAFGNVPVFEDRGNRRRAILAIGRQDVDPSGIRPLDPRIEVLGASSDHLILDVDALPEPPAIGEVLSFVPNYSATLRLFTSPYVDKRFVG